ncbi:MAG TPA: metalloregulator ArsR/SmtB family transcription factor [Candidatus Lumbricidophila sp.]|nr:metalloregulator ArsR/SmtB family transcription factor [Candidatus Lumbricidophila sp.]
MADIFDVVADATRRDILSVLLAGDEQAHANGEVSVSEIVTALDVSQPTISKHLKVLREAGLVVVREEGQHRYYRLDRTPLEAIEDWLIPYTSSGAATDAATLAVVPTAEGLNEDQRALASRIGKVAADTAHSVSSFASQKLRRG